jgi:molybdenum cofactor synthesis domain-containing protein
MRIGILTISDRVSAGQMEDLGSDTIAETLRSNGWSAEIRTALPDDRAKIAQVLRQWCDEMGLDVVLTTGGTGLGPRDVTPEATLDIADRTVPGVPEAMRYAGLQHTPMAMLSRAQVATRGTTLIVNLPGSPNGAREGMEVILPVLEHAIAIMHGGRH